MVSESICRELARTVPDGTLELGELEAVYSADFTSPADTLVGAIGFAIVAALGVAGLVFLRVEPDQQTAKNIVMAGLILITLPLSLFALAMCVRSWGNRFRHGRHWLIYSDGLGVLEAGTASAHPWSDVTVWFEKSALLPLRANRKQYKLTGRKKRRIPLPWFNKRKCLKLMLAIQDKQAEILAPRLAKALQAGEVVRFGGVVLTQAGISVDGQSADWEDVSKFEFAYDRSSIDIHMSVQCRTDRSLVGHLREIPNVWLMFSVVSAIRPKIARKAPGAEDYLK